MAVSKLHSSKMPSSRWRRDPGIAELIEYFDQPKFMPQGDYGDPDQEALSDDDWKLITKEADACRRDFVYAAKNYFWITNKDAGDQLFSLWECQEIVLDKILEIRAKGKAQKLIILKSRQMGISTLAEGLVAWGTAFNPNINAIVVGPERKRSEYLFSIMLHIYDHLPWWLRPMCANRKYDGGLVFDNPDPNQRRLNPGLRSRIEVQMAGQYSGVGQGIRLNIAHISELADFQEEVARDIVQADLGNALALDSAKTLAMIESTAKGAGTYYHELCTGNIQAGEKASWHVVFVPAFMEKTRFLAPEQGWHPQDVELEYRDTVKATWVRCDNRACDRWRQARDRGISYIDVQCPYCLSGTLRPYELSDGQLCWFEDRRKDAEMTGAESVKRLRQELSITETEAFQLSGDRVFPDDVMAYVARTVRDPTLVGFLDEKGQVHAVIRERRDPASGRVIGTECFQSWCNKDHRFDASPLRIWEMPHPDHQYIMGVDVAEGLGGKHDYSVINVNRIGKGPNADAQVAVWSSNEVNHYDLAVPVVQLGQLYNWAVAAIEYTNYQTCGDDVRIKYNYPNIYRWKHLDSTNIQSSKWHWITNGMSKPKLWGGMTRRVRHHLMHVRADSLAEEMKTFQKGDEEDRKAEAESGYKDDQLIACMIALHCAHETDSDEDFIEKVGGGAPRLGVNGEEREKEFDAECLRPGCGEKFELESMPDGRNIKCPKCSCIILKARKKGVKIVTQSSIDIDALERGSTTKSGADSVSYDSL